MATAPGQRGCFDTDTSIGWEALQVLLLRKELGTTQRAALFQASKSAARVVISCSDKPLKLTFQKQHKQGTLFTSLLRQIPANASGSKPRGAQVHLTLHGVFKHALPKDHIAYLCLKDTALTREQWQDFLTDLQHHTKLGTLRLKGCTCYNANPYSEASSVPVVAGAFQKLEIDSPLDRTCAMVAAMPTVTGALARRCSSIKVPATACVPWITSNASFAEGLKTIHLTVDSDESLRASLRVMTQMSNLQHVTLNFNSLRLSRGFITSPVHVVPAKPWQSLTLSGSVHYNILASLPIVSTPKVSVLGSVYTHTHYSLEAADSIVQSCPHVKFSPVPSTSATLRTAGLGKPKTLHVYSLSVDTLATVVKRMSPDVECLSLHAMAGAPALNTGCLDVLARDLPAHVRCLHIRLENGLSTAHIFPHNDAIQLPPPPPPEGDVEEDGDEGEGAEEDGEGEAEEEEGAGGDGEAGDADMEAVDVAAAPQPAAAAAAPAAQPAGQAAAAAPPGPPPQLPVPDPFGFPLFGAAMVHVMAGPGVGPGAPPQMVELQPPPGMLPPLGAPGGLVNMLQQLIGGQLQAMFNQGPEEMGPEEQQELGVGRLLAKLPRHVKTVCVEVVNDMVRGPKRAERWSHVLRDVAIGHSATTSIKLVLSNVRAWPFAHDGKESLGPWLQEEKDAVLRWRDEHTGSDGKVDVCFV